jgi:hypothetical protein
MPNEARGPLDAAIDRAIRGLMQIDPAPGLRHRVADRLEARVRRTWAVPAFAAAAAILVAIVALSVLRNPEIEQAVEPRVAIAPPAAPSMPTPQAERAEKAEVSASVPAPPRSTSVRPRASRSIFGERTGRVSAASLEGAEGGTTIEPPEPPANPPLARTLPPLEPITIAPITVAPIRIQPLTPGPIRR